MRFAFANVCFLLYTKNRKCQAYARRFPVIWYNLAIMKRIRQTLLTLGLIGSIVAVSSLLPTTANALECGILPQNICDQADQPVEDVKQSATWSLLTMVLNIMTAGVAIAATGGLIYAAVLYTSAGPNQQQVAKSKEIIRNIVIGIVAFALMYSLLQWLIPGGVF